MIRGWLDRLGSGQILNPFWIGIAFGLGLSLVLVGILLAAGR